MHKYLLEDASVLRQKIAGPKKAQKKEGGSGVFLTPSRWSRCLRVY